MLATAPQASQAQQVHPGYGTLPIHADTPLFDAYVVDLLKRWGRTIGGPSGTWLGYPRKSTLHAAMIFHGPAPRANGPMRQDDIDPEIWLCEQIVSQIALYDLRMATVLRAAFLCYGSWCERMSAAQRFLERSRGMRQVRSRTQYYAVRDEGIREVRYYLLVDAAA